MIDVRLGTRQASVVQQENVLGDVAAQGLGDPLLPHSTAFPASLVSRLISQGDNGATE